ncbi:MAG TPA: DNA polymerase IV [Gemmatimonadales bacterium]
MAVPGTPRILQVDADAFYVQVARLGDPEGAGKAEVVLVGGTPQGRGVVTSASYSARKYGARSGMPMAQALRLCPEAMVVGVPGRACSERSKAIHAALERFAPIVEPASIDEMYLDLTGTETLYKHETLEQTARRIREAVRAESDIVVSVGGGTTRLVAKLAANRAKPHRTPEAHGVLIVPPGEEGAFLKTFPLAAIPGIGPRFQDRLAVYGLKTVPDALRHDRATLEEWFGQRAGHWLYDRIRGVDPTPVVHRDRARSISRDETFAENIDDDAKLRRELLRLSDRAAGDLRTGGYVARTVTVRIRDRDFKDRSAAKTLRASVSADAAIATVALELFAKLRRARRIPARLLGVALSQLGGASTEEQLGLFADDDASELETDRDRRLSRAIDELRKRFGRGVVGRG